MANNEHKLKEAILSKSQSKKWYEAVKEWSHVDVYEVEEAETCLCGHYPITEVCVIQNHVNNVKENVGNCCVKKFFDLRPDHIVKYINKLKTDIASSVNISVLDFALQKKIISQRDYNFYSDIWRKRNLSEGQEKWKLDINKRILKGIDLSKKP